MRTRSLDFRWTSPLGNTLGPRCPEGLRRARLVIPLLLHVTLNFGTVTSFLAHLTCFRFNAAGGMCQRKPRQGATFLLQDLT